MPWKLKGHEMFSRGLYRLFLLFLGKMTSLLNKVELCCYSLHCDQVFVKNLSSQVEICNYIEQCFTTISCYAVMIS